MQRTSIEWCDFTWNPLSGCLNKCPYCYAARMARRLKGRFGYDKQDPFRPTFHEDKVTEPDYLNERGPYATKPRIFTCSMGDIFSEGVESAWIRDILNVIQDCNFLNFLVLTKRPERILELIHCITLPDNLWWGVSVTKQQDLWRIAALRDSLPGVHKFVSFEPLHGPISPDYEGIEWAIIGAESRNRVGRILPQPAWIAALVSRIPRPIPVFMKENLRPHIPADWDLVQQFPEGLQ